jgi:serine O-acetyltransferase
MKQESELWRVDLLANCNRSGAKGAVIGWFTSPGFAVATYYRIARWALLRGGLHKLVSMIAWRRIVKGYGCYISPKAPIGPGLRLPHPIGVVVAETASLGRDVTLYQGVTIGRRLAESGAAPVLEDEVTVYANASLVGDIRIGRGAVVAANAVVLCDVPPGAVAAGVPAKVVLRKSPEA